MNLKTAPYGSWLSPITSDLIVAESIGVSDIMIDGDDIYWIEARPREAGRCVVVRRTADGTRTDMTPAPFSARTRVHEYGGGACAVHQGSLFFANYADQRLYRLDRGAMAPTALTPAPPELEDPDRTMRYGDGTIDAARNRWIGVRQDHISAAPQVVNTIVAIDLAVGGPGVPLVAGNDFYSSPRLLADGTKLAWLTWQLPNMPWDGTELWVADIAANGSLANSRKLAGGVEESIYQPEWGLDGALYFVSDRSDWWNLYRFDALDQPARALCPMLADFGQAQWNLGMSSYAIVSAEQLICSYSQNGAMRLARFDLRADRLDLLDLPYQDFSYVRVQGERIVCRAGSPTEPAAIVRIDPGTAATEVLQRTTVLDPDIRRFVSMPAHVEFPTAGGLTAHCFYYAPSNPCFAAAQGDKPPLVVKCHGGPTSSASSTLDLRIQYWTSRGIAVIDVDYGGSTGYGRQYRNRLRGQWGIVDVNDCVNAAKNLVAEEKVDPARIVITGGSAGGYTTLAALTFRDFFKGGASYYGVSDAAALARDTHKFESRYLDTLIGPYPEAEELYRERSPAFHADRLSRPVVFFQGDEDRIVPPNQTQVMVTALRQRGVPVGYFLFTGEQHGFRKDGNIKRSLDAELYFYATLIFATGLTY
jgi:dipeptidyl aminopeptidase/acylaminoacyl peptidase